MSKITYSREYLRCAIEEYDGLIKEHKIYYYICVDDNIPLIDICEVGRKYIISKSSDDKYYIEMSGPKCRHRNIKINMLIDKIVK